MAGRGNSPGDAQGVGGFQPGPPPCPNALHHLRPWSSIRAHRFCPPSLSLAMCVNGLQPLATATCKLNGAPKGGGGGQAGIWRELKC